MDAREIRVRLPLDVPPARYTAIVHAVAGVLDAAGMVARSSIFVDEAARDEDLNAAFADFSALYPLERLLTVDGTTSERARTAV